MIGFDAAAEGHQAPGALATFRLFYIWIPVVLLVFCLFAISRYSLTRGRMKEIRAELEARRGIIQAGTPRKVIPHSSRPLARRRISRRFFGSFFWD